MPPAAEPGDAGPHPLVGASRAAGVRDERVLDAIAAVPRARFVPVSQADAADRDRPVPIARGQVTTQPSLVAVMVEALGLRGDERVLEVGTGLGYQAAVLARLCAHVWSVERHPDLADAARAALAAAGVTTVDVVVGDGTRGLPEHAPYDAVILAAAFPDVPRPLVDQLRAGGRLVQPVGPGGAEDVTVFERSRHGLAAARVVTAARFVPLVGEHGHPT